MLDQWNQLLEFLAASEIKPADLPNGEKFGLLILAGNSLPLLTAAAGEVLANGFVDKILLSGGIGHATHYLRENYRKIGFDFSEIMSEAEMNRVYLQEHFDIPSDCLLVENQSTNSGENARFSRQVMQEQLPGVPQRILLLTDPLLQRRTKATFQLYWDEVDLYNFSPFVPKLTVFDEEMCFSPEVLNGCWQQNYFVNLALGEIPRLRNNSDGYGPKGKNFIVDVAIPPAIETTFSALTKRYHYNSRR